MRTVSCLVTYARAIATNTQIPFVVAGLLVERIPLVLDVGVRTPYLPLLRFAAQIDGVHTIEFFAGAIRRFYGRRLHAGIVEGCIQVSEREDSLLNHRRNLIFVGNVTADREGFVARGDEFLDCRLQGVLIMVR